MEPDLKLRHPIHINMAECQLFIVLVVVDLLKLLNILLNMVQIYMIQHLMDLMHFILHVNQ